jgi:membrane protein DedA with SNARE-associated domain
VIPTDVNQVLELIRTHGELAYGFVFGWALGNSFVILIAGYAAYLGAFSWGKLVLVCWLGGFAGDAFRFWVGRRYGARLLSSFPRIERAMRDTERMVTHHFLWMILMHRYVWGIRNLASFAFGISRVPTATFLALNFVSAGLWSVAMISAGYAFSHLSDKVISDAASRMSVVALVVFVGLFWLLSKRLSRALEKS